MNSNPSIRSFKHFPSLRLATLLHSEKKCEFAFIFSVGPDRLVRKSVHVAKKQKICTQKCFAHLKSTQCNRNEKRSGTDLFQSWGKCVKRVKEMKNFLFDLQIRATCCSLSVFHLKISFKLVMTAKSHLVMRARRSWNKNWLSELDWLHFTWNPCGVDELWNSHLECNHTCFTHLTTGVVDEDIRLGRKGRKVPNAWRRLPESHWFDGWYNLRRLSRRVVTIGDIRWLLALSQLTANKTHWD